MDCLLSGGLLFELKVYWTLDVSRTASYEIALVRLSVFPSVTKFSQGWIISFFLILYMMIAGHDI